MMSVHNLVWLIMPAALMSRLTGQTCNVRPLLHLRGLHKLAKEGLVCLMESCDAYERQLVSVAPWDKGPCTSHTHHTCMSLSGRWQVVSCSNTLSWSTAATENGQCGQK